MITALLLCATALTLTALAGAGWLVHALRPRQVRIHIRMAHLLRLEIELSGPDRQK